MQITHKLKMDLMKTDIPKWVEVVQGDSYTRVLEVSLYADDVAWSLPEGASVLMRFGKPDGTGGRYDTLPDGTKAWTASGNVIQFSLAPQVLSVDGDVGAQLEIVLGSAVLASFTIEIHVERDPASDTMASENYFNWAQWADQALSNVAGRTENAAAAAEEARDAAASASKAATDAAASAKEAQEAAAVSAETAQAAAAAAAENVEQLDPDAMWTAIQQRGNNLYKDPETGILYLMSGETMLGEGVEVGSGSAGLAFDGGYTDEEGYLHLTLGGVDIEGFDPIYVGTGGGSGGYGSTMKLTCGLDSRIFSILDSEETCEIPCTWSSVDAEDGTATGSGTATWTVNGSRVANQKVEQGDFTFDVRPYLTAGAENSVKLTVSDAYGNSKNLVFTISVTSFGLSWNLGAMAAHGSNALSIRLTPTGSGLKTVKVSVDGVEVYSEAVATSGRTVSTTVEAQAHGAHTVLAWMEMAVEGETLSTEPLRHVGIWTVEGNPKRIVGIYEPEMTVPQFGTAAIQYMVVDPAGETAAVELQVDGATVSNLTVDRSIQVWAYKAQTVGAQTLSILCGTTKADVALTVQSLGYDIQPVTSGLVLDIDPSGHSNAESGRTMFGYVDGSGINHPFTYSDNFDWVNGGFVQDEDGVAAFVIKRGCSVTLDCSLFADNAKLRGKNIKLIYKSDLVRDYDATIMTCKSGNVGLVVQAQQATVSSELETMTVPYCEGRKIEMDISIEPTSGDSLAMICLKSIPSCPPIQYGTTDSWAQGTPAMLTIGSEDCDVWIYRIKMYDCWLNRYEILDNYIADCGDPGEMVQRFVRNDIYNDDGTISLTKLAQNNAGLRVETIRAKRTSTGKSDAVPCDVEQVYIDGGESHHFIAENAEFKQQGTSSLAHADAAPNVDVDYAKATKWTNGNGEEMTDYAFTPNSIPINYVNYKANVASSESANNVVLADDYNTYDPYVCAPKAADSRVRDCIEGHPCAMFFTNTSDATISVGARTLAAGETMLWFVGDMNNSKKNFEVFGQNNDKYPKQCCVEILNNNNAPCRFRGSDWDNEAWDGKGDFEFRFPKNPTDEMKQAFMEMHSWVVSTTLDQATDTELPSGTAYGGVVYYYDSREYRAAKFLAEFENYFVKDQMLFHYLFTDRHCMVDNRAKNVFFCYEYIPELNAYRWSIRCNYDDDTAEGTDNSGGNTFGPGIEDTDIVGNSPAFNAHDSTIWCNIRDLMFDDLRAAFASNKECWDSARILKKFLDYQAIVPEALRIEDMYNKYVTPYLVLGADKYPKMCFGTKEYQREHFETYQDVYFASHYWDPSDLSNVIETRTTCTNAEYGDVAMTPYCKVYLNGRYGNAGGFHIRAERGVSYLGKCPADTLTDTETYFGPADRITKLSGIAAAFPKLVRLDKGYRMQELDVGSSEDGYANLNITDVSFTNNPMLEKINIAGLPNVTKSLDLRPQTGLQELYAEGSGITGIVFAKGAPLKVAKLPALASIIAQDLTDIETFTMNGKNLLSILVDNCPGIDTLALCKAASGLNRGRLPGIDWVDNDADVLLRLATLGGMDADGEAIDKFVISGKAHLATVTSEELTQLEELLPDVEITYDQLVTGMTVTFVNYDGTVLNTQVVRYGKDAVNPITAGYIDTPIKPPTDTKMYIFKGWSDYFTNVTTDLTITAVFTEADRVCTVRWWADMAETQLLQEDVVDVMGSAYYQGDDLPDGEETVWLGWDKDANLVTEDLNIHARYVVPSIPDVTPDEYDYLFSDDPADNSAYSIGDFLGICKSGRASEYFSIGDEIKIVLPCNAWSTLGDVPIVLQVYGYNHFKKADGSGEFAKVVFGIKTPVWTRTINSTNTNAGGWYATEIRAWFIGTVFPLLPAHWRRMIELVEVISTRGEGLTATVTAEDHLFLFAEAEVFASSGSSEVDSGAETVTFPIFTDDASRIRGDGWKTRSPRTDNSTSFYTIGPEGDFMSNGTYAYAAAAYCKRIVFGFCIG